ncbi:hypothetical protein ACFY7C_11860 [Streptomyces sp. NPDC012769]|uniref:hypothetical protein n=1 Tax=Streptomyces sp. NPDC012769 TaxID=3364848 RepID=UPI00368CEB7B
MADGVTLYSEPDFKGESCFVPWDEKTYSLAATGLDKIASVKVNQAQRLFGHIHVRLYLDKPERLYDLADGSHADFPDGTADTGKHASAGWLQVVNYRSGLAFAGRPNDPKLSPTAVREIHETLPA